MNKNTVIGGIIIMLVIVWGIWYFASPDSAVTGSENASSAALPNETAKPATVKASTNTFRSIFTQSGSHECLYEQADASSKSSSRIYIADGKMRGEFRTISGTDTNATLMVYIGGILYTWKEGATTGKKSSIKSAADLPEVIPADLTSGAAFGVSLDNVSWDCHNWAKDPAMLTVPAYVKFS